MQTKKPLIAVGGGDGDYLGPQITNIIIIIIMSDLKEICTFIQFLASL